MNSPLSGITVLELAGLAPSPFCGLILSDFGANVIRLDRFANENTLDFLSRGKRSISIDLKSKEGVETVLKIIDKVKDSI